MYKFLVGLNHWEKCLIGLPLAIPYWAWWGFGYYVQIGQIGKAIPDASHTHMIVKKGVRHYLTDPEYSFDSLTLNLALAGGVIFVTLAWLKKRADTYFEIKPDKWRDFHIVPLITGILLMILIPELVRLIFAR